MKVLFSYDPEEVEKFEQRLEQAYLHFSFLTVDFLDKIHLL